MAFIGQGLSEDRLPWQILRAVRDGDVNGLTPAFGNEPLDAQMAIFILCPSIRFRLRVTPQKLFFRSFFRSFARRENFSSTRNFFRSREHIRKKSLGRRDRFRQRIVKIGVILAIFRPFEDFERHDASSEVPIWRSCEFLSVSMTFVSKNYPRCPKIQLSTTFGGGVKS